MSINNISDATEIFMNPRLGLAWHLLLRPRSPAPSDQGRAGQISSRPCVAWEVSMCPGIQWTWNYHLWLCHWRFLWVCTTTVHLGSFSVALWGGVSNRRKQILALLTIPALCTGGDCLSHSYMNTLSFLEGGMAISTLLHEGISITF